MSNAKFQFKELYRYTLYFLKSAPYKLLKSIVFMGSSFSIIWLLANYSTPELLGNFQFILATTGILAIFSLTGMKEAALRSISAGFNNSLIRSTKISIYGSLIGSLVLIVMSVFYYSKGDFELTIALICVSFFFPFYYTLDNFGIYLTALKRFKEEFFRFFLIKFFQVVIISVAIYIYDAGLVPVVILFFLIEIIFYVVFYTNAKKEITAIPDDRVDDDLFNYGWLITKVDIFIHASNHIDRFLLGLFTSPNILATYAIGTTIPNKAKSLLGPLLVILFPVFTTKKIKLKNTLIIFIIIVSSFSTVLLIVLIPILIQLFFPAYADSVAFGQIYAIVFIFAPVNKLFNYFYKAKKIIEGIRKPIFISNFITVFFSAPSFLIWGLYGMIFVQIFSTVIEFVINLVIIRKYNLS